MTRRDLAHRATWRHAV